MDAFTQQIAQWQWFFGTVSASAATFTGLLFVSLSVNRSPTGPLAGTRLIKARRSFGDFIFVLMMGLVFLVPHQVPGGLALALLVLGVPERWASSGKGDGDRRPRTSGAR